MFQNFKKRAFIFGLSFVLSLGLVFNAITPKDVHAATSQEEGFSIGAFNNPDYTFQTIDGGSISTKALPSKDVTLLLFGRTTCASSWLTVKYIAESSWIHDPKISVIYVEIDGADAEAIQERIEYYSRMCEDTSLYFSGCEKITFCQDAEGKNEEARKMYQMYSGKWGTISLPMIMMVDKNNVVWEILTGLQTADSIQSAMLQVIAAGEAAEKEDGKKDNTEKDDDEKDNLGKDDGEKDDSEKDDPVNQPVVVRSNNVHLSKTGIIWNGKAQKPSIIAKDDQGNTISSTNYTVTYSNNKNVGQATVTITFKNRYTGTIKKTFTIKPKGTTISKVSAAKKGFTVQWNKQKSQTTGYEIQYSTSSKFKNAKTLKNIKTKATSKKVTKLKTKKKYYVRIRTYKTAKVNGKSTNIYSEWSKAKSVVTKK